MVMLWVCVASRAVTKHVQGVPLLGRTSSCSLSCDSLDPSLPRYLLHSAQMPHPPTVSGILQWTAPRALTALDSLWRSRDQVENELQRELDNGRLFRLLAKLGVVNERPE